MIAGAAGLGLDLEENPRDRDNPYGATSGDRRCAVGPGLPQRISYANDSVRIDTHFGDSHFTNQLLASDRRRRESTSHHCRHAGQNEQEGGTPYKKDDYQEGTLTLSLNSLVEMCEVAGFSFNAEARRLEEDLATAQHALALLTEERNDLAQQLDAVSLAFARKVKK